MLNRFSKSIAIELLRDIVTQLTAQNANSEIQIRALTENTHAITEQHAEIKNQTISIHQQHKELAEQTRLLSESNDLLRQQNTQMQAQIDTMKKVHWNVAQDRQVNELLSRMATQELMDDVTLFLSTKQISQTQTIESIRDSRLSLSRFGDGEFKLLLDPMYNIGFQGNSPQLRNALQETLTFAKENPNVLRVAVPPVMRDPYWARVYAEFWPSIRELISDLPIIGDAMVSRPDFFAASGMAGVAAWRSVWENLSVRVVTGQGGRFDVIPELFDNVRSIDFTHSLPMGAFSDIPRVLEKLDNTSEELILLSLGPAGTILAAELAKAGRWAIDIGHVSSSYLQIFRNAGVPESTPIQRQ